MRRSVLALVSVAMAALASTLSAQRGQQPPLPAFRVGTDLIPVDVSVLDKDRRPVRGLVAADFTVLEDGRPRPIVAFSAVDLPRVDRSPAAVAPWVRDAPHDVVSNHVPAEGRLVVILMDRWIPTGPPVRTAQRIAEAAVDELGPGDLAAVARSSGFANEGTSQGFTADHRLLLDAIESPIMGMTTPPEMTGAGLESPSPVPDAANDSRRGECYCGLCVFETIDNIARAMRDAPRRRKTILFIGSAIDTEPPPASICHGLVRDLRARTMTELDMSNVTVDSIDPIGLLTTSPDAAFINHARISPSLVPRRNQANMGRLDDLRILPDHTGGRLVANTNTPQNLVPAIFAESQSYYLLGVEPIPPASDGASHTIDVRVRRRGVTVHARKEYLAPARADSTAVTPPGASAAGDVPVEVTAALDGALPRQDLPLALTAAPFRLPVGRKAAVAVALGATLPVGVGPHRLDITVAAFDARGRSVGVSTQTVEVPAAVGQAGKVDDGLLARLDLPPGRYELRAAAKDETSGTIGSVFSFVDVPAFDKGSLTASGLILHGEHPPLVTDNPLADILPVSPTVARVLSPAGTVRAFLRVYQPGARQTVSVTARVIDAGNRTVFEQRTELATDRFLAGATDVDLPLPLKQLAPGPYLLTLEVARGDASLERSARFEVSAPER